MTDQLKTSEDWMQKYIDDFQILDKDGWDRKNIKYSWYEELITEAEFKRRVGESTCRFMTPRGLLFNEPMGKYPEDNNPRLDPNIASSVKSTEKVEPAKKSAPAKRKAGRPKKKS